MAKSMPKIAVKFDTISDHFAWYTIVTKFNYEAKFIERLIEQLSKREDLLDYFDDVFVPERKCTVEYETSKGTMAKRILTDKTMSLYVFIKVKMTEYIYWFLRNIEGCSTILATGDTLISIPDDKIKVYREDSFINSNYMKGMQIITKNNPFHNPINKLKNLETELPIITVKKFSQKSNNENIKIDKDDKNRIIVSKRTKEESIPKITDINSEALLKRLNKLLLVKKFMKLDKVSCMSDEDLTKLQESVMQVQRKLSQKPSRKKKKRGNKFNNK